MFLGIRKLIDLVTTACQGFDCLKEGAVGSNGYGFVFRDFDYTSKDSFFIGDGSSRYCSVGEYRHIFNKPLSGQEIDYRDIEELRGFDSKPELYIGGALKTLIPNIEFGGDESLFDVWMFVKTPKGRMFPANLYYSHSSTTIGGWNHDYQVFLFEEERELPSEFQAIINFSPFDFSEEEREEFIEALLFSLAKVPVSDFEGSYKHDMGVDLMGVESGKPFTINLTWDQYRKLKKE